MRSLVLAVVATAALSSPSPAAESNPLVTKVFAVADLVMPIPDLTSPVAGMPDEAKQKQSVVVGGQQLMKMVTCMVRPNSWNGLGGSGKLEFFDIGQALVVTNTAEVIAEVGELLEAMRRLQDFSVVTQVHIVTVPAGFCERVGVTTEAGATLSQRELKLFLKAIQENREANVMQLPKVTTFDGQSATIRAGERRTFVTGGELVKVKGQPVFVPKKKEVNLGDTLTLCGRVSADRKSVDINVKLARTTLVGEVELVPVSTIVTPVFAGGSRGKSIPFTQFLEAPELRTQTADQTAVVPDGGTIVMGGWTETSHAATVSTMTKIPYVGKLFKEPAKPKECQVVVLATTRIVCSGEKSEKK
jgi:type II secretory pathway component GspD/PulD (secretin)